VPARAGSACSPFSSARISDTVARGTEGSNPPPSSISELGQIATPVRSSRRPIVNPLTLHGQAIGGVVQGLGGAFLEHLVYDANGHLLSGNLADYLIPTATDFPKIRAITLENHRSPSNPLGVKAPARARSSRSAA